MLLGRKVMQFKDEATTFQGPRVCLFSLRLPLTPSPAPSFPPPSLHSRLTTGGEHGTRDPLHARQPKQNLPCVAGLRRLPLPEADVSEEPEVAALDGVEPSASTASFRAELRLVRFFL